MNDEQKALDEVISAIEQLHLECEALEHAYRELPWWAVIRQNKNMAQRRRLLAATKPFWADLNAMATGDLQGKIGSVTEVFR